MLKKTVAAILVITFVFTLSACGGSGDETKVYSGTAVTGDTKKENISAFSSTDLSGEYVSGGVFGEADLTMVNIWGTYCGPCIQEMPALGKLSGEFGDSFQIVGIPVDVVDRAYEKQPALIDKAQEIVKQTGADYTHIIPTKELQNSLLGKAYAIPCTVFVDSAGNILGDMIMGARSEDEWRKTIKSYLEAVK